VSFNAVFGAPVVGVAAALPAAALHGSGRGQCFARQQGAWRPARAAVATFGRQPNRPDAVAAVGAVVRAGLSKQ
jgi:hypothetical protein